MSEKFQLLMFIKKIIRTKGGVIIFQTGLFILILIHHVHL
jgi:hypothetical protein